MRSMLILPTIALAVSQPLGAAAAIDHPTKGPRPGSETELQCPATREPLAPPVQDYDPSPAMWKLADEDTTIHIFGTYHILPDDFRWRTELFDKTLSDVDELVLETAEPETGSEEEMAFENAVTALIVGNFSETPLSERISEENGPKLERLFSTYGMSLLEVEHMPPILSLLMVAVASSEQAGADYENGVESTIEAEFAEAGKPIGSIEDSLEVMQALFDLDENVLINSMDAELADWDGCSFFGDEKTGWKMEHSWAKGELNGVDFDSWTSDPFGQLIYDALLLKRNTAWAAWVEERMARPGNLMLAVGAGHMEGDDSLILMLEERGFEVERVQ